MARFGGLVLVLVLAVAMLLAPGVGLAACADWIRFEPNARLSVSAISKLADQQDGGVQTPKGGAIVYWPFDHEDHPFRGEWAAMAIVYASAGDPDDTLGGVIWINSKRVAVDEPDRARFARQGRGVSLTFQRLALPTACQNLTFTLNEGGRFALDGKTIGALAR